MTMKTLALLSGMCVIALPGGASAQATHESQAVDTVRVQVVDRTGKPPFTRKFETLPVQDVAQFEALSQENAMEWVEVRTVDMSGKPPYQRKVERLRVIDIAQFEEIKNQDSTDYSGRPPFKRHR
ncbi:hypothetical protein CA267_017320 [Alteromonas pelagimontana]|uniref:Uncharacterized protein n=1 Tax=Alteromonas pelagimontana TaxID=1858656 RepID=A0A6M4MIC5_9ALTE|nr:hypothetical protein [Alteromonas pelagimontana]QJR82385.1 hypothetical protein CA267_017320 [Alteromonas pelagimontana]